MNIINFFIKEFKIFFKFGLVGIVNTAVSFGVYYLVVAISQDLYFVANFLGWLIAVAVSFVLNNTLVFKDKKQTVLAKLLKTYISYLFSLIVGSAFIFVGKNYLNLSVWLLPILSLFITVPMNFLMNRLWVYNKKRK